MVDSCVGHPLKFHTAINTISNENFNNQNKSNAESFSDHYQHIDHYYNLENISKSRNFSCEICNRSFYSRGQYQKHVDEHVDCPFPECGLKANLKIIDQHISHQHMLVNFEALQIDDEAWIAERKKRFPSARRAELRRAEQLEKIKRGERLGKDTSKFASREKGMLLKNKSKSKNCSKNNDRKNYSKERKNHNEMKETNVKKGIAENKFENDSDSKIKLGVEAFKGTRAFYESIGEVSLFGFKSNLILEEKQYKIDISDEEEWSETVQVASEKCVLQNALGSLMGAYDSESDVEINSETITQPQINPVSIKDGQTNAIEKKNIATQIKMREPCDNENILKSKRKRFTRNNKEETKPKNLHSERRSIDTKFKPNKYRRRTLLQKLLEPEIVHERNVILQCVRYIVDNNFFDSQTLNINS